MEWKRIVTMSSLSAHLVTREDPRSRATLGRGENIPEADPILEVPQVTEKVVCAVMVEVPDFK
jgi:hypothetical protein